MEAENMEDFNTMHERKNNGVTCVILIFAVLDYFELIVAWRHAGDQKDELHDSSLNFRENFILALIILAILGFFNYPISIILRANRHFMANIYNRHFMANVYNRHFMANVYNRHFMANVYNRHFMENVYNRHFMANIFDILLRQNILI
ncbi:hypothetical protein CHUAL_008053 [Chamberlinius hualienensis]